MSNGGGPQSLTDWIQYLHAAAAVPKGSADYAEARQAIGHALLHINALNVGSAMQEANQAEHVGTAPALAASLVHGLSLGTGEPLSGLASAVQGKGFASGAQAYREGLGNVEASHPYLAPTAELAGNVALPAGVVGSTVGNTIKAGVPLTLGQGVGLLGRGAVAQAVPAAVAGFSAGGEDPGDFAARGNAAVKNAALAALLSPISTLLAARATRAHVEHVADIAQKGNQRALTASRLAESQARLAKIAKAAAPVDPMRAALLAAGVRTENIDAQIARNLAATQKPPTPVTGLLSGDVAASAALPHGTEAVTPIAPQGIQITGPDFRPPSVEPSAPTLAEMTGMANLQAPRGLLGEIPLTTTVPNAEGLLSKELSAAQETAARSQRGLTKAQLAYRASLFDGKPVTGSYANLVSELEDAATTPLRRKQIIAEFRRRGIVNKYTQ